MRHYDCQTINLGKNCPYYLREFGVGQEIEIFACSLQFDINRIHILHPFNGPS
jgi:hypothetical protein